MNIEYKTKCKFIIDGKFCNKNATYGYIQDITERCKEHKEDRFNVTNPLCITCIKEWSEGRQNKTPTQARYGIYENEIKRYLYCAKHVPDEDIYYNLKDKHCEYISETGEICWTIPVFGSDIGIGKYCKSHKEKEMTNVRKQFCKELTNDKPCEGTAIFGLPDGKTEYCGTHRREGMVNLIDKMCEECRKSRATYGHKTPTHCGVCGVPKGMINLKCRYCDDCEKEDIKEGDI